MRVQLSGSRPPPGLRHLWLADCIAPDASADTWQGWRAAVAAGGYKQLPPNQPPVELAWVQVGARARYGMVHLLLSQQKVARFVVAC